MSWKMFTHFRHHFLLLKAHTAKICLTHYLVPKDKYLDCVFITEGSLFNESKYKQERVAQLGIFLRCSSPGVLVDRPHLFIRHVYIFFKEDFILSRFWHSNWVFFFIGWQRKLFKLPRPEWSLASCKLLSPIIWNIYK